MLTIEQMDIVAELQEYARINYSAGGHWIYETTDDAGYLAVYADCGSDMAKAKAYLKEDWELFTDLSDDICGA
jgi:hypothetical protein